MSFTTIDKEELRKTLDIWGVFKEAGLPIIDIDVSTEKDTRFVSMFSPEYTIEVTDQGDRLYYEWGD